jgi:hypothetical protein
VAFREDAREHFLADLRALTRDERAQARRLMVIVRRDPLVLRPGWRLLPFPWQPGTAEAVLDHPVLGTIAIRFAVETDDAGAVLALIWLRASVR